MKSEQNMENYYAENRNVFEHFEQEPLTGREEFAQKLRQRNTSALRMPVMLAVSAAAAALLLFATVTFTEIRRSPSAVELYYSELRSGIQPLYEEVVQMEAESERCGDMALSAVIEELMDNSHLLVMQSMYDDAAVRNVCDAQVDRIRELYKKCSTAYYDNTNETRVIL